MLKKLFLAVSTFAFLTVNTGVIAQDTKAEKEKIQKIVKEYILENPEIVLEAIQILQERQRNQKAMAAINENRAYLYTEKGATELGNPNGDITIVEFFDYRCGYCKRHYPELMRLVNEDKNIRLILKHYPILDYRDESKKSRNAAFGGIAASKQGKFAEYHDKMMRSEGSVTDAKIQEVASQIGLDMIQFNKDMKSAINEKMIMNSLYAGQALELTGTPAYIIGSTIFEGARGYDHMKNVIKRERAKSNKSAQAK